MRWIFVNSVAGTALPGVSHWLASKGSDPKGSAWRGNYSGRWWDKAARGGRGGEGRWAWWSDWGRDDTGGNADTGPQYWGIRDDLLGACSLVYCTLRLFLVPSDLLCSSPIVSSHASKQLYWDCIRGLSRDQLACPSLGQRDNVLKQPNQPRYCPSTADLEEWSDVSVQGKRSQNAHNSRKDKNKNIQ